MRGATVAGVGLLTGWGEGIAALPADARAAAGGRRVVALRRPALAGERFRRATRECLLGVAAVEALLRETGLTREAIQGSETALIYVTAAAYGASNVQFIEAGTQGPASAAGGPRQEPAGSAAPSPTGLQERAGALHFPYTAPSAVPGEVAIEFVLTGPYVILIGGAAATLAALRQAARLLAAGRCRRALVLAVETFAECEDLWARARGLVRPPLVEAAACALLLPLAATTTAAPAPRDSELEARVRRRAGETLACAPLVALALSRAGDAGLALEAH